MALDEQSRAFPEREGVAAARVRTQKVDRLGGLADLRSVDDEEEEHHPDALRREVRIHVALGWRARGLTLANADLRPSRRAASLKRSYRSSNFF